MKLNNRNNIVCLIMFLALIALMYQIGVCSESRDASMKTKDLGGLRYPVQINGGEIENIGRFAVQEHNKNQNNFVEFTRVVKAKEQIVTGKIYHLTLEAVDGGKKKIYEAKVWVKPWMNFKQLQEFKQAYDSPSFAS